MHCARRRLVLTLVALLAVVVLVLPASTPASAPGLHQRLASTLRGTSLAPGRTAAIAVDLSTGTVVYAHNASRAFVPASAEKLPVSWAALTRLGPGWRFRTEIVGDGSRTGTTWVGDLVLKGYGDPTLSSGDLDTMARTIRASGIRTVRGGILGDESFFDSRRTGPGWKPGYLGIESPPLSALVVDRALGWPASAPPLLAARAFRKALQRTGIRVTGIAGLGTAPVEGPRLVTDLSVPLAQVVRAMNSDSDNFTAELVLKQLGAADGAVGTTARGAAAVLAELTAAGIPTANVRLVDGSGLSSHDRLTAAALVGVIRAGLENPEIAGAFRSSLAVAGRTGTLARRFGMPAGVVRAKTGTTNVACTLAGLVRGSIAFAVLQNGDPIASWAAREAQDRFVSLLAAEGGAA